MKWITPTEFSTKQADFTVIDVREPYEYQIGNLGFPNVPMAEVCEFLKSNGPKLPLLLICKSGNRASAVANYLETELNFPEVNVLEGGLQNWHDSVDNTLILDV
mgnify:CR=1 FL=1